MSGCLCGAGSEPTLSGVEGTRPAERSSAVVARSPRLSGATVEERPFRAASASLEEPGFSPWHTASHSANAFGVDTPTSGVTTTQAIAGKSSSGYTCSPRPTPSTVPPTRNSGRSDPTSAAIRNRSVADSFFRQRSLQPQQRRHRIPRSPAQPALHRQPLLNLNHHAPLRAQRRIACSTMR